jgi:hypothetical protein
VNWDSGSGLGIAYGADSCRKIENEATQDNPARNAIICTLDELIKKMEPQYKIDQMAMRDCIDGLGVYAAHKAKENRFASEISNIRELIEGMIPYWGLDRDAEAKQLEDFLLAYDETIHDAMYAAAVPEDTRQACTAIVNGLYLHGQDLTVSQGSDAMGEILRMSDLIKAVPEYFGYESDSASKMSARLIAEVRGMLNEYAMPGQAVEGITNAGYEITRAILFENDRGFAFAHNPVAASPFVTWQMFNDNGRLSFESGNYYGTEEKALVDIISRVNGYKETYGLEEKPLPERDAPESVPERKLIRFIDSDYRELFQIPDGESIRITYLPGDGREPVERECKFYDEYHFSVKGGGMYHICQFAESMERLGARYEPVTQLHNVELMPFAPGEDKFYKPNREEGNTCVGIISGDFMRSGDRYNASWNNRGNGGYTPEIQSEIQSVIYALRKDLLKDHDSMLAFCDAHPDARLLESDEYKIYGFKLETNTREYFIRCFAEQDSRFTVYAYADKPTLSLEQAEGIPPAGKPEAVFSFGDVRPGTSADNKMFYRNDEPGSQCIGYLRGDFGKDGRQFFHSWTNGDSKRRTPEFQSEFKTVVDALRENVLKDHKTSADYCRRHSEAVLPSSGDGNHFGFKVETDSRQYYIRCSTLPHDYFYIFAYDKAVPALERGRAAEASTEKGVSGYSSVLKAIEDGKKTPKPRKEKETNKRKNKSEEL